MFNASQARESSLLRFQVSILGLRSSSKLFGQAVGEREQQLAAQGLDPLVEQRQIDRSTREKRLALGQRRAGLGLAEDDPPVAVEPALRFDQRIGDEAPVHLQRGNDVHDQVHAVGLVRRPWLAQRPRFDRPFDADHQRQEIRGPADGGRAVLGTRLAEAGHVLGDREIAGHADFWPPPMRIPLTRQITGLSQARIALTMSLNRRMYCRYSCGWPA